MKSVKNSAFLYNFSAKFKLQKISSKIVDKRDVYTVNSCKTEKLAGGHLGTKCLPLLQNLPVCLLN